jgi:hypothetical protein
MMPVTRRLPWNVTGDRVRVDELGEGAEVVLALLDPTGLTQHAAHLALRHAEPHTRHPLLGPDHRAGRSGGYEDRQRGGERCCAALPSCGEGTASAPCELVRQFSPGAFDLVWSHLRPLRAPGLRPSAARLAAGVAR